MKVFFAFVVALHLCGGVWAQDGKPSAAPEIFAKDLREELLRTQATVGEDGHSGLNTNMDQWLPVADAFLSQLGFDRPAIVKAPPPSAFAAIDAISSVPVGTSGKAAYAKFLEMALPRAFAVSSKGGFGVSMGDYAAGRALGNCQRFGNPCTLYAVDSDVVWKPQ